MRKARQDELPALAALMFDQFYEKEEAAAAVFRRGYGNRPPGRSTILSLGQDYFEHGDVFRLRCGRCDRALVGTAPCSAPRSVRSRRSLFAAAGRSIPQAPARSHATAGPLWPYTA